jgi:hypothetical protein
MNIAEIESFLSKQELNAGQQVKISFRQRDTIYGVFVKERDYADLKSKNFWRIVRKNDVAAWQKSKNIDLAKIFNGSEFSRLSMA